MMWTVIIVLCFIKYLDAYMCGESNVKCHCIPEMAVIYCSGIEKIPIFGKEEMYVTSLLDIKNSNLTELSLIPDQWPSLLYLDIRGSDVHMCERVEDMKFNFKLEIFLTDCFGKGASTSISLDVNTSQHDDEDPTQIVVTESTKGVNVFIDTTYDYKDITSVNPNDKTVTYDWLWITLTLITLLIPIPSGCIIYLYRRRRDVQGKYTVQSV